MNNINININQNNIDKFKKYQPLIKNLIKQFDGEVIYFAVDSSSYVSNIGLYLTNIYIYSFLQNFLLLNLRKIKNSCLKSNIKDIDFAERAILITRKGQKQDVVYYGDEVEEALNNYLKIRNEIKPAPGSEDALFLSGQNRRISNRAVEYLVKKYAGIVTPLKHITPHKLRSTFGTNLYQETGDIYLVATVLGHTDVNTTRKHYASQTQENKILASKAVRLRKEKND